MMKKYAKFCLRLQRADPCQTGWSESAAAEKLASDQKQMLWKEHQPSSEKHGTGCAFSPADQT